jgi:hypothetical protein
MIPIECEVLCVASHPRHNFCRTIRDIEILSLAERDGPEMGRSGYSDNVGREMRYSVEKVGSIPRSGCLGEVRFGPFQRVLKQRPSAEWDGFDPLGHLIKIGRFDRKQQRFREDSRGNTSADI